MPVIAVDDRGPVRLLTLDRPASRNALDRQLRTALLTSLDEAEGDDGVRALVLTGRGSAFCAGMDLAELEGLLERSPEEHLHDSLELGRLFERLYLFPKPLVAAVNGPAVAGGAGLASVCDVVLMAHDARIGYTEARIGFVAALVGVFLTRSIGERRARELLLEARMLDPVEAVELGLASAALRADEDVVERGLERARSLAANSPQALAATKRLMAETSGVALPQALRRAAELNALARGTDDLREGIRAFLEKRQPRWRSRL